ncbi:hypothetical protein N7U66_17420 [Lacinutrix neustonica]|uniref:Uncharacterized protein n=1 Tax=Lacinutrix neustonica TaxID=2980107 RepID=A0A9E8SCT5_9FLAO|nr:hypothetical protein [Lacinutrix neustonica]WAC01683.1 hypothetical protein N7U66_17420 [Lacinutrix neustonica]
MEKEPIWSEIIDKKTRVYTGHKVIVTTTNAKGGIENDKSGANFNYDIPCRTLFEGLNLKYSSKDGDFNNECDEVIVTNINPKGTLVKKSNLMKYLNENNLSIIWTVYGQKIAKSEDRFYHFGVPSGVFYFEKNKLTGKINMYNRDD